MTTDNKSAPEKVYVSRTSKGAWMMSFNAIGDDDVHYAPVVSGQPITCAELVDVTDADLLEKIADEMPDGPFQKRYAGLLYQLSQKQRATIAKAKAGAA